MKRWTLYLFGLICLPGSLFAAGISIDSFTAVPSEIYAHTPVKVTITAHISNLTTLLPTKVLLKRLQADGNMAEVAVMYDDGTHGDLLKDDRTYTAVLKLKEKISGLLCYSVEAIFPNGVSPLKSKPLFIKIMGKLLGS